MKYYASDKERKTLIEDLGDAAYILYARYLEKAGLGDPDLEDNTLASELGWNYHKVRRVRRQLMNAGWLAKDTGNSKVQKRICYYLGKPAQDFNLKALASGTKKNTSEK